jgi:hypothetical protein
LFGGQRQTARLRDIPRVDVAPEVPSAFERIVPGREALIVVRLHDVRKAQADVGMPVQRWNWRAISSETSFDSA